MVGHLCAVAGQVHQTVRLILFARKLQLYNPSSVHLENDTSLLNIFDSNR